MVKKQGYLMRRLSFFCAVGFFVLSAFGCGGGGGGDTTTGGGGTTTQPPSISTQGALDFGVAVTPNSLTRVVTVRNSGPGSLVVGQISLAQSGTPFSITSDTCSNQTIAANGTCSTNIVLNAASAAVQVLPYTNTLSIPSNDSATGTVQLSMSGKIRNYFVNINEVKYGSCPILQLLVSVTNAAGAPVLGLESSFSLFENGVQKIPSTVNPATNDPFSVVLLLDYSPSILNLTTVQEAAKTFIDQLKSTDEISIVKFSKTLQPTAFPFTLVNGNKDALKAVIDQPFTGDITGTALYDAVFGGIDAVSARVLPRRAVIVMSDGYDDNTSARTLDEVIALGLQESIPVFSIGIMNALIPQPQVMQDLALGTGGSYFEAPNEAALQDIYLEIAGILSDQYLIEYLTGFPNGSANITLDVDVNQAGNLGEASRDAIGCL